MSGLVYLIGAGPGDPDLITVKGLRALQQADVIVYDRLSPPELLAYAKPGAELINAGKQPTHHTLKQDEINAILMERAGRGLMVARLKGGDPFVFGRGGEEAEACVAAGVPFVVIPGVSSAIAVPAYAGIPVTHRDLTSVFAVVTGHEDPTKESISVNYEALAQIGTLVFLMGVGRLGLIADRLIAAGRSPETPVVCIEWGTTPRQRVIEGTLATIPANALAADLQPPTITVVGEVAALRDRLRWFEP